QPTQSAWTIAAGATSERPRFGRSPQLGARVSNLFRWGPKAFPARDPRNRVGVPRSVEVRPISLPCTDFASGGQARIFLEHSEGHRVVPRGTLQSRGLTRSSCLR